MSEEKRETIEKISKCYDQMSDENKRYLAGFVTGYAVAREEKRDKARAEQPAAEDSTNE